MVVSPCATLRAPSSSRVSMPLAIALCLIVAESFAGQTPLERHRSVYQALDDLMKGEIHALALQTLSPEEFRR